MAHPEHGVEAGRPTSGGPHPLRPHGPTSITDARTATSQEMSGRVRRYTITMAFRTACFVSMIFVGGWGRWVLLACAVLLPYVAVLLANASDQHRGGGRVERGAPEDAPQLTTGEQVDVISGEVEDEPEGRVA